MYDKTITSGYIALITTLVVGSVTVLLTIGMLSIGITQSQTSSVWHDTYRAGMLVDGCVEHALQEIRDHTNFSGSSNQSFPEGFCSYEVDSNGGESKTIEATAVVNNVTRRALVEVDEIEPAINITKWIFVESF